MDGSFGRPEDKMIEKEFMKRIRGDKLQTINAECELEICLAFHQPCKKLKKNRRSKEKETNEGNSVLSNQLAVLEIPDLTLNRREDLEREFNILKNEWKFEEIEQNQPLPDYFFDDGCDLSYILYQLQKKGEEYAEFKAEQLIWLELLCLKERGHLKQNIFIYYKENMIYLIDAMKAGLAKIQLKLKEVKLNESKKLKERKDDSEENGSMNEASKQMLDNSEDEEKSKSSAQKKKKIRKVAKKGRKKKGKKSKSSDSNQSDEGDEENPSEQNNYSKDKQIAIKTCNYIAWAYWYIIQK